MREECFIFRGDAGELVRMRADLTEVLRAEGWSDEEMIDVLLAADELATNAVVHARTPFDLHCVVSEHVELEVIDHDPEHVPHIRPADGAPGGFGLRIVERVAREWGVEQRPDTKHVRVVLDRDP
jgi:anti-sigma regulatory factor (Ser/Thr protein kinase)